MITPVRLPVKPQETQLDFLRSALILENPFMPTEQFLDWIREQSEQVNVTIRRISFAQMNHWDFDANTGSMRHDSGKFFSVQGIRVNTNWGIISEWEQPIINQPEIGYLGIITKKIDGVLYFLMQAKIEPGNLNVVQLSPTLQATKSNYNQVHGGKRPPYLEYFNGEKRVSVLLDQLQSEQGARFLKKRNRNIIVLVDSQEDLPLHHNFCWLTLGQIKQFLGNDNLVNMDTRTVISGVPFGDYAADVLDLYEMLIPAIDQKHSFNLGLLSSTLDRDRHLHGMDDIISWITRLKSIYELEVRKIPLRSVKNWRIEADEIFHEERKYFSVIGAHVEIENREVASWDQPMVRSTQEGIIAFIVKTIDRIPHFLVQAKLEAGNFDVIELAPTVQCLTGNYRPGQSDYRVMFLDYVLNSKKDQIWYDTFQSEEGGRFFQEQNRNMIIEADDDFPLTVPDTYIWMTLHQIKTLIKYNNFLNMSARSLIAVVRFSDR